MGKNKTEDVIQSRKRLKKGKDEEGRRKRKKKKN